MGAARIEVFRMQDKRDQFPGQIGVTEPLQVEVETTSTTATTAGSRHVIDNQPSYARLHARITVDEDCWVAIGADPTADAGVGWLLKANQPLILPVKAGDKVSFKDVA